MTSVAELRALALLHAKSAAAKGFGREPNVDWLMRRSVMAAMRWLARSDHPCAAEVAGEWVEDPFAWGVDWAGLPADGPAERVLCDSAWDALVECFDFGLGAPDEPKGRDLLRRVGIGNAWVLCASGDGDQLIVSRCTRDESDRWFRYWSGGCQDGNWMLTDPTSSYRTVRRSETREWAEEASELFDRPDHVEVNGDEATYRSVRWALRSFRPDLTVSRAARGAEPTYRY